MSKASLRSVLLVPPLLVAVACGAEGEEFFGVPAAEVGAGVGGSTSASVGGGSSVASTTGTSATSGSSADASVSASTSVGSSSVGSSSVAASTSVAASSSVATSSASGGASQTLACDQTTCNLASGESCCWDNYNFYGNPKGACVTGSIADDGCKTFQNNANGAETRIECQTSDQCSSGKVCCARRKGFQYDFKNYTVYDQVTCESSCTYPSFLVCVPNVTTCPTIPAEGGGSIQSVCKKSSLLPDGYFVCGSPP